MQPKLPFTNRVTVDFDLGVQGEQDQAAYGQRGGFETGRVLDQAHGPVDHRGEFGAAGGQVGEGGAGEVTVAGWRGAGSAVGPQVGMVSGVGEGGGEFPEPGGVRQRGVVIDDQGQDADGVEVGERVDAGAGHGVLPGVGGKPIEGGGEDRGVDVVQAGEKVLAVPLAGQHPAQSGGQGGPVGGVAEAGEGVGELSRGVTGGGCGGDGGDDRVPVREEAVNGVLRWLLGDGCGGGQQVGQGTVGGVGVGAQGGDQVAEVDTIARVNQADASERAVGSAGASGLSVSPRSSAASTRSVWARLWVSPVRWSRSAAARRWARCSADFSAARKR